MKWLPVPSVPRCLWLLVFFRRGYLSRDALEAGQQLAHIASTLAGGVSHEPLSRLPRPTRAAVRHGALDRAAQAVQVVGQVGGGQRGAHRHHAAADIDADRGGNDRALRRDHAADGRALAEVHVGHHRQVAEDEGQLRRVHELLARLVLDRHAVRPHLDRLAVVDLLQLVFAVFHVCAFDVVGLTARPANHHGSGAECFNVPFASVCAASLRSWQRARLRVVRAASPGIHGSVSRQVHTPPLATSYHHFCRSAVHTPSVPQSTQRNSISTYHPRQTKSGTP